MTTVTIEEAQTNLGQIIAKLTPGDEVVITDQGKAVARLIGGKPVPVPGRGAGTLTIISDDDDYLEDWSEYMP